jgi:flagellar basal-body rod protein FlgB
LARPVAVGTLVADDSAKAVFTGGNMAISFDKALGDLPAQLTLFGKRSTVLASNLANADTPGFKARDIDFRTVLAAADARQVSLKTTQAGHISAADNGPGGAELLYRTPVQPSLDGNTVNSQVEQAEFTENAVRYQSTLTFLNGKFRGLKLAIKGE